MQRAAAHLGVVSPRNEAPDDYKASFVPMRMIAAEYGLNSKHEPLAWGGIKKGYTHFAEGDVGLAKITPCFGKQKIYGLSQSDRRYWQRNYRAYMSFVHY